MTTLPADILDLEIDGSGLNEPDDGGVPTLRDQLAASRPTLLVFLRHFGCCFCREMVKDVRIAAERADARGPGRQYPRVVFVHLADAEEGELFFGDYWPGAAAVADPEKRLYDAVGLGRGSMGQMFGPRVWACGLRAFAKGHGVGRPVGDPWTMPALLLLAPPSVPGGDAAVLWEHRPRHAGDHPDFDAIPARAESAAAVA